MLTWRQTEAALLLRRMQVGVWQQKGVEHGMRSQGLAGWWVVLLGCTVPPGRTARCSAFLHCTCIRRCNDGARALGIPCADAAAAADYVANLHTGGTDSQWIILKDLSYTARSVGSGTLLSLPDHGRRVALLWVLLYVLDAPVSLSIGAPGTCHACHARFALVTLPPSTHLPLLP